MSITLASVVLGLITGMGIGALALGLVLVYRASRVINLAHAELGAAAAAVMAILVRDGHLPYGIAAGIAIGSAAAAGALIEVTVIRRLRRAPRAVVLIATLGVDDLAATYLGGTSFTDLVRAGRAAEQRPGAALAATRLFAWDPLPWAPTYF